MTESAADLAPFSDHSRPSLAHWLDRATRLERRVERERQAREEAERLLEGKSRALFDANQSLIAFAAELEGRVEERTRELAAERQRALRLSEEDALTGLANRALFARLLKEWVEHPQNGAEELAVVLVDLDEFKSVNDTFGHPVGDEFLRVIAQRMLAAVRPEDLVARLGGDEFAVLARGMGGRQAVRALAERIARAINRPIVIGLRSLPARCSLGTAQFPHDASDVAGLLRDADAALYLSKRHGLGKAVEFNASLRADMDARALHEAEVRQAIETDQIKPWLQPVYCCIERRFVGAEILARWHHPKRGILLPARFLSTVETLGLLDRMTEGLARHAFARCAGHLEEGRLRYLALNLSPTQVSSGWARERLPFLIASGVLPSRSLLVEITEHAVMHNIAAARSTVASLSRVGVKLAIDDFGIGYSNFSLLRDLSVHVLKLDRSLSIDMESDPTATAIVECIVALAQRLGIVIIAEGVQTRAQAASLHAAGCRAMQGWLFSRPRRDLTPVLDLRGPDVAARETKKDGRVKTRP